MPGEINYISIVSVNQLILLLRLSENKLCCTTAVYIVNYEKFYKNEKYFQTHIQQYCKGKEYTLQIKIISNLQLCMKIAHQALFLLVHYMHRNQVYTLYKMTMKFFMFKMLTIFVFYLTFSSPIFRVLVPQNDEFEIELPVETAVDLSENYYV